MESLCSEAELVDPEDAELVAESLNKDCKFIRKGCLITVLTLPFPDASRSRQMTRWRRQLVKDHFNELRRQREALRVSAIWRFGSTATLKALSLSLFYSVCVRVCLYTADIQGGN